MTRSIIRSPRLQNRGFADLVSRVMQILVCGLLFCIFHNPLAGQTPRLYYIAPSGNDSWSGMLAAPNRDRTEKTGLMADEYREELGTVRVPSQEIALPDLDRLFAERGVEGTFLLYDEQTGRAMGRRQDRWDSAYTPASTFKIFSALVALETGVIATPSTIIRWDRVRRSRPEWNRDHTLASAFKVSAVWFYQELARRIGAKRMQAYLDSVGYGNRTMGGPIDGFWLEGDLRITPRQQVEFLHRLHKNQLPFSRRTMALVKEIMIAEQTPEYTLRGKTGLAGNDIPEVGWYVGYIERGNRVYVFATELDIRSDADVPVRVELSRAILKQCGLL